ncbi:MAG: hypothetical protein Fur003_1460 [Candidatus Dojkabacteria bacterium]
MTNQQTKETQRNTIEYEKGRIPSLFDKNIMAVAIEGGDRVGKDTLTRQILEEIVFSKSIEINGETYKRKDFDVIYTSFPQYYLPTGDLCRRMARKEENLIPGFFQELIQDPSEIPTIKDQLALRAGVYAFDRLLSLIVIERYVQIRKRPYILISDRGPLSNTVTTSYLLGNDVTVEQFDPYFEFLYGHENPFEAGLLSSLKWNHLVVKGKSMVGSGLAKGDELETEEVQDAAAKAYNYLIQKLGLTPTYTQFEDGTFRPYKVNLASALEVLGIKVKGRRFVTPDLLLRPQESPLKVSRIISRINRQWNPDTLAFNPNVYRNSFFRDYIAVMNKRSASVQKPRSREDLNTQLENYLLLWQELAFTPKKSDVEETMRLLETDPKEALDKTIDPYFVELFKEVLLNSDFETGLFGNVSPELRQAFRDLDAKSPHLMRFLQYVEEKDGDKPYLSAMFRAMTN